MIIYAAMVFSMVNLSIAILTCCAQIFVHKRKP